MPLTFDESKDRVARLVQHFRTNRAAYRGASYKEAQARQEFIDPVFIALGWDVHNDQQSSPAYREVVVEASQPFEGHQRAPDYAFRVGRETKFFAEAKPRSPLL
jgi:predicted type IV restriction endonuclease